MNGNPKAPSVSVCFPAYNEEGTIARVLREAHGLLSGSGLDYEIIVCDDGSTDRTGEIIKEVAAECGDIRVLHNRPNRGIRYTFERLYHEAAKDFVFLNAADGQWATRILFDLLPETRQWDIIIAARQDKHYGPARAFVSWCFNLVTRGLLGVKTRDAGAVKLIRREIIGRFEIISQSPFSEAERLARAARAGYRIIDRPVAIEPRRSGRAHGASLSLIGQAAGDALRVWLALRREPAAKSAADKIAENPKA